MGRPTPPEPTPQRRAEARRAWEVAAAVEELVPTLPLRASDEELAAALAAVTARIQPDRPAGAGPAGAEAASFVILDDLEVTQEVQDLAHSVPLVAGKVTVVRVYLSFAPPAITVRGELLVARSQNGPWTAVPALATAELAPAGAEKLHRRRADLRSSLNFRLPDGMTAVGATFLRLGTVSRADGGQLPSVAGLAVREVTFRRAVPMRLRLVRFRYRMAGSPVVHEPSATDEALITSWLRRAYPIAELQLSTTTATAPDGPFEAFQVNAQLLAMRAADVLTGTDPRTHYYGLVSDSGFFMRGFATDVPATPRPNTVASGPTGPHSYGWDHDGSYGDWYGGHELAHTFGRPHANFCGADGGGPYPFANGQLADADEAFVGLDVGDPALGLPMRALQGTTAHDLMSYCEQQWLSSFTYTGIYDRLLAEDALSAGPRAAGPAPAEPATHVIAAVDLTGRTGSIAAVLPAAEPAASEPHGPDASDGAVTVRILDDAGTVLDERQVPVRPGVREEETDRITGLVDAVLTTPRGGASIELRLDGSLLDSHPLGGDGASVGAPVRPKSAGPPAPDDLVQLRWPATGTGQRYAVQLSHDGGAGWATVAVGLAEPAVTLSRADATGALCRVLATSGSTVTVLRTDAVGG